MSCWTIIWRLQVQSWLQVSKNTGILNTCTWLWLMESEQATPCGFNKRRSSKFRVGSRVLQIPEEGWRTYQPKRCGNNNKDEDNSSKTLNDKKPQDYYSFANCSVCVCVRTLPFHHKRWHFFLLCEKRKNSAVSDFLLFFWIRAWKLLVNRLLIVFSCSQKQIWYFIWDFS